MTELTENTLVALPTDLAPCAYAFKPSAGVWQSEQESKSAQFIQLFNTGKDLRAAMLVAGSDIQVIILEQTSDVSPLNLAAALHKDCPCRDIYLLHDEPSAQFISSARAAGTRGVIDSKQVEQLVPFTYVQSVGEHPGDDSGKALTNPADDEEVCTWDELETILDSKENQIDKTKSVDRCSNSQPEEVQIVQLSQEKKGKVVSYFSGRGGTGKSTLSLLSSILLLKKYQKVALVDLDLQFGDLSYLAGHESGCNIVRRKLLDVLDNRDCMSKPEDGLLLVEPPTTPELAEELLLKIPSFLEYLQTKFDFVVVNTSTFWTEAAAHIAQKSDRICFVMDQRATSLRGCKQAADLCVRLHVPSTRFVYLLNRCSRNSAISDIDASLVLDGAAVIPIADGGKEVDELLSLGCPHELLEAMPAITASLEEFLQKSSLIDESLLGTVTLNMRSGAKTDARPLSKQTRRQQGFLLSRQSKKVRR